MDLKENLHTDLKDNLYGCILTHFKKRNIVCW